MTVTYTFNVATSSFFTFHRLLFRWKGSVWQAVWVELSIWCLLYAILSIIYRLFLIKEHKATFEDICIFFDQHSSFIPVTFMLGFYVSAVFNRWWEVFNNIGWIDQPALQITQAIRGDNERSKMLRRTCIRYLVMLEALVFRDISPSVRRRFPTMNHLVTAGLMTEKELKDYDAVSSPHAKYWLPVQWLLSLITLARDEGRIHGEVIYVSLLDRMADYRSKLINLVLFDWVPVPLVYTQVVHLAVYSYFGLALFGRQLLEREGVKKSIDLYVPIMSILQFTFIVGWVKVAEVLLNPLGEDDDDFECNWIIDRNMQVGFSVEECYDNYPPVDRDAFWQIPNPEPLYTAQSAMRHANPQVGSCVNMAVPSNSSYMLRSRRATQTSHSSGWDVQLESDDIVPVIQTNGHIEHHSRLPQSISSSSMSNFIKKIKQGGRRMSSLSQFATRRRTASTEPRTFESPDILSSISSLDRAGSPSMFHVHGHNTPPALHITPPTPTTVVMDPPPRWKRCSEHAIQESKMRKRHSAPDALQLAKKVENSRRDSYTSTGLPIILEESRDKSRRQSDASSCKSELRNDGTQDKDEISTNSPKKPKQQKVCDCNYCT
ncbi:hypothetical protein Aduo_004247 [Ancylostoma duodenale]